MINPYWELIILLALINVIFAVSLNLILGYNGQFALGHAGFLLIGAYASGVATSVLGWPLWAAIALAIALATLASVIVGYPSLRLRGDYLAIATLGFAEIIRIVVLTLPATDAKGHEVFGGPTGKREVLKLGEYLAVPESMNGVGNFIATLVFAAVFIGLIVWGISAFANFLQRRFQSTNPRVLYWLAPALPAGLLLVFIPAVIQFFEPQKGANLFFFTLTRLLVLGIAFNTTKTPPLRRLITQSALVLVLVFWPKIASTFIGIFQFNNSFRQVAFDSKQWALFALYALIVGVVLLLIRNYLHSSAGRSAIAIREDEIAASNLGLSIFWVKLRNFMFGCGLAGLAGALTAHTLPLYRPADFDLFRSVDVLLMVVLGGMGSLTGSVLGATLLTVLPEVLRFLAQWRLVIYSLVLILFMVFRPGGIMGRAEIVTLFRLKLRRKDQENVGVGPTEVRG
ncbi:MAG: branched-chain amino acid ABC transporter permease [bacterium]|nr:branched-chain amino acid ABC transporter permease [bacterium]